MKAEKPYDAGNVEHVRAAKVTAKERAARDAEDLGVVMSTMSGRRWMWALLDRCGVYRISYREGDAPTHTAFLEGARNVGNKAMADLMGTCPQGYALMCKEKSEGHYE